MRPTALGTTLFRAVFKSILGRYAVYAAQLTSLIILARIFGPELFGIVGTVQVLFLFFQLLSEAGLGPALINTQGLSSAERNGIFSLTLLSGLVLAGTFIALARPLQAFYGIEGVAQVVPFFAAAVFFFAAAIVPIAALMRDQRFLAWALVGFVAEVTSTVGSVALWAAAIDPLHALASKYLILAGTNFVGSWLISRGTEFGQPWPGMRLAAIRPILSFSLHQFGFNFINYFSRNLDNILVGRFMGAAALGIYGRAYQLMRYPLMLLTMAVTPAIQPVVRKHAESISMVEKVHRTFTFTLASIAVPVAALLVLAADQIVLLLLGEQWEEVGPIIAILAISVPVQAVLSTSGSFFQALNRPGLLFLLGCLSAVVMVTAIVIGVFYSSLEVLSWALVAAFHINFVQAYYILYRKVFRRSPILFFQKMVIPGAGVSMLVALLIWQP